MIYHGVHHTNGLGQDLLDQMSCDQHKDVWLLLLDKLDSKAGDTLPDFLTWTNSVSLPDTDNRVRESADIP